MRKQWSGLCPAVDCGRLMMIVHTNFMWDFLMVELTNKVLRELLYEATKRVNYAGQHHCKKNENLKQSLYPHVELAFYSGPKLPFQRNF